MNGPGAHEEQDLEDRQAHVVEPLILTLVLFGGGLAYRTYRHHELARATAIDPVKGIDESLDHFREAVEATDLPSMGMDFAIPFFVFQGAGDRVTPVQPVREYVDSIRAPRKELVLFPNAGHNVIATRSDEFLSLLVQRVRPLAVQ